MDDYVDTAVLGTEDRFAIGQPVPRSEDPVLLRGEGHYSDDFNLPGQAYAVIVRSPMAHGGPRLYDDVPENVGLDFHFGDSAAVAEAFARAAHVTRLELRSNRIVVNPIEPRAALAEYDPARRRFTLHVGCQGVFGFRNYIAGVLGIGRDAVRLMTDRVGGSFGMKQANMSEYFCLLHAARELRRLPGSLDVADIYDGPPSAFPNGCHIAEVEVDPETGVVEVVKYTFVNDFGVVINPLLVDGQAHGGIVQGIGQALRERVVYDDDGQLLTGSFMDYAMPRADDAPFFVNASHPVPATTNPLGAKGCGEAGCAGALPSVMNALVDALSGFGSRHIDMPATPERVWQAIREARAG